jgi:hypothetical protein
MNASIMPKGWMEPARPKRHKARLFGFLSVAWCFITIPCAWVFLAAWPLSGLPADGTARFCLLLSAPHPLFIILAIVLVITERPRV